jgi:hypothetical protein
MFTKPLNRVDDPDRGRRYGDQKLPSVTTILSATKDKSGLDAWAERVGRDNAERIKNEAATVGTHMHNVIERMLAARDLPRPTTWLQLRGYEMGYRLINAYFCHLKEVWGSEVTLYYPGKYAGTTDLVGVYRDQPAIVDFKQSIKPKQAKWIQDYFHQLAAYAMAHDIVHGTSIEFAAVSGVCAGRIDARIHHHGRRIQAIQRRVDAAGGAISRRRLSLLTSHLQCWVKRK